jgi:hypothetical protein
MRRSSGQTEAVHLDFPHPRLDSPYPLSHQNLWRYLRRTYVLLKKVGNSSEVKSILKFLRYKMIGNDAPEISSAQLLCVSSRERISSIWTLHAYRPVLQLRVVINCLYLKDTLREASKSIQYYLIIINCYSTCQILTHCLLMSVLHSPLLKIILTTKECIIQELNCYFLYVCIISYQRQSCPCAFFNWAARHEGVLGSGCIAPRILWLRH